MGQLINVASAARKLGVSRVQLQRLIRSGDLQTFEGQVDFDALKRLFPVLAINSHSMLETTKIIRDSAYAQRIRDTVLSSQEELEIQLKRLRVELTISKVKETENTLIMREFVTLLASLQQTASTEEKNILNTLSNWFNQRVNKSAS